MAGFFKNLINFITNKADVDWDELEAMLIAGDLGPRLALEIVEELRAQGRKLNGNDIVAVAQAMFPLWAHHPAAAGLRVHLSNGFYANAVCDRWLGGWSTRRPS